VGRRSRCCSTRPGPITYGKPDGPPGNFIAVGGTDGGGAGRGGTCSPSLGRRERRQAARCSRLAEDPLRGLIARAYPNAEPSAGSPPRPRMSGCRSVSGRPYAKGAANDGDGALGGRRAGAPGSRATLTRWRGPFDGGRGGTPRVVADGARVLGVIHLKDPIKGPGWVERFGRDWRGPWASAR